MLRLLCATLAMLLVAGCSDDEAADGSSGTASGAAGTGADGAGGAGGGASSQSSSTGASSSTSSSSVGSGGEASSVSIACGRETCGQGQKCCMAHAGEGYCAGLDEDCDFGSSTLPAELYCDDESDCPEGACCVDPMKLPYVHACASSCEYYEACVVGGACSAGLCLPRPDEFTGGICDPDAEVMCDSAACSGASFACCWDGSSATCSAPGACSDSKFLCDEREDCGDTAMTETGFCCASAGGSSCQATCAAPDWVLCESLVDCPYDLRLPMDCAEDPSAGLPPGLFVCVY